MKNRITNKNFTQTSSKHFLISYSNSVHVLAPKDKWR